MAYPDTVATLLALYPDTLMGYWKLNEASGPVDDSSGRGHTLAANGNPTYQQGALRTGSDAESVDLDETGDYFSASDHDDWNFPSGFTGTAIVQVPSSISAATHAIFSHWYFSGSNRGVFFGLTSGHLLQLQISENGSSGNIVSAGSALNDDTIHHVSATYDGSDVRLYVDDSKIVTTPISANFIYNNTADVLVGSRDNGADEYKGLLSDVTVWNKVLSDDEIFSLHTAMSEPDAGGSTGAPLRIPRIIGSLPRPQTRYGRPA